MHGKKGVGRLGLEEWFFQEDIPSNMLPSAPLAAPWANKAICSSRSLRESIIK